ncbi:hypothetical protein D3C74_49590 [compost metagenome]
MNEKSLEILRKFPKLIVLDTDNRGVDAITVIQVPAELYNQGNVSALQEAGYSYTMSVGRETLVSDSPWLLQITQFQFQRLQAAKHDSIVKNVTDIHDGEIEKVRVYNYVQGMLNENRQIKATLIYNELEPSDYLEMGMALKEEGYNYIHQDDSCGYLVLSQEINLTNDTVKLLKKLITDHGDLEDDLPKKWYLHDHKAKTLTDVQACLTIKYGTFWEDN